MHVAGKPYVGFHPGGRGWALQLGRGPAHGKKMDPILSKVLSKWRGGAQKYQIAKKRGFNWIKIQVEN